MITGSSSGLVETITDAVSIHSIKKAEYAKRLASGKLGHVTLLDHFLSVSRVAHIHALTDNSLFQDIRRSNVSQISTSPTEFRQVFSRYAESF